MRDRHSVPERSEPLADKTAFGYAKNYYEERELQRETVKSTELYKAVSESAGQPDSIRWNHRTSR